MKDLEFVTKSSGSLFLSRGEESASIRIVLPRPSGIKPPRTEETISILNALLGPAKVKVEATAWSPDTNYVMVVMEEGFSREDLEAIEIPGQAVVALSLAKEEPISGVVVTCKGERGVDILSRFFGPWIGIPEDSVTGSAHAMLGPYWADRLGRSKLSARQCSKRGGELELDVLEEGVRLTGSATIVVEGKIKATNNAAN